MTHNPATVALLKSHHPEHLWEVGYCFECKTLFFQCPDCGKTIDFKVSRRALKQWMPLLRKRVVEQHPEYAYAPENAATKKPKQKDLV